MPRDKAKAAEAYRERRAWYIEHGICPRCGRNDIQRGYKSCLECRMADREKKRNMVKTDEQKQRTAAAIKALKEKRKAEGICVRCGKRKVSGRYVNCVICRKEKAEKQREYNRRQGRMPVELRGEGYCARCYKPIDSGRICPECSEHLEQQAAYMRSRQDNNGHIWQTYNAADVLKCRQTNGEPPRTDFCGAGGKVTLEENRRHTEEI